MNSSYEGQAEQIIKHLNKRKGFDAWWECLARDIQKEIIEAVAEIIADNADP